MEPLLKPVEFVNGQFVTRKEGFQFMNSYPDLSTGCPIETWKPAEKADVEVAKVDKKVMKAWGMAQTFKDILEYRMDDFTPSQRDQWRALHAFHKQYATSGTVPVLPLTLRYIHVYTPLLIPTSTHIHQPYTQPYPYRPPATTAETNQSWTITHGMPVSWNLIWQQLAWRFPRPHQPGTAKPGTAADVTNSTVQMADITDAPQGGRAASSMGNSTWANRAQAAFLDTTLPVAERVALINCATGIADPKFLKARGVKSLQMREDIGSMAGSTLAYKSGTLCFVRLQAFEGEFCIGLARMGQCDDDGNVEVTWLEPRGLRKYVSCPCRPIIVTY